MPTLSSVVSLYPYFLVADGKMREFKYLCEQMVALTSREKACLYYGFSFSENQAHCREAYQGAESLLAHLANVGPALQEALKISSIIRLEVHGAADEIAKLLEPMSSLNPTYFTLEYELRSRS